MCLRRLRRLRPGSRALAVLNGRPPMGLPAPSAADLAAYNRLDLTYDPRWPRSLHLPPPAPSGTQCRVPGLGHAFRVCDRASGRGVRAVALVWKLKRKRSGQTRWGANLAGAMSFSSESSVCCVWIFQTIESRNEWAKLLCIDFDQACGCMRMVHRGIALLRCGCGTVMLR